MPDVHERLREAAPAPTTTPDFEELWTRGRRHRRLARGGAIVGALTVIAAAIVVVPGLFDDAPRPDVDIVDAPTPTVPPATARPGWTQIAPSPLSPRQNANVFWTGEEVLVIGGNDAPRCLVLADCAALPDESSLTTGAAYDPSLDRWRPIAEAPTPLGTLSGAVLGDVVYLFGTDDSFLSYSVTEDEWSMLPPPPHTGRLVAAGDRVVVTSWSHEPVDRGGEPRDTPDLVYQPETRTWNDLADDPLRPSFDRRMVWTGDRLVLLALSLVDQPNSTEPNLYHAAGYDFETGEWTRLADSEVVGWDPAWFWVDDRIVNPSPGSSDGGETNNWGRPYPHGGMYDPATDTWEALPPGPSISEDTPVDLPPEPHGYGFIAVAGGEYAVASGGWLLHVPTGTWQALAPPDGAPTEGMATVWAGDRLFLWGGGWFDGDTP